MNTKEKIRNLLEENEGRYLSGQEIADSIFVTRACVWKNIKALQDEGMQIDAVTNKGYRLRNKTRRINSNKLERMLSNLGLEIKVIYYEEVTSTNDVLKDLARENVSRQNILVIADSQSCGRGRRGRSFYSPKDTGLYMSLLLYPDGKLNSAVSLTAIAAVAVAMTIDEVAYEGNDKTSIKWVNDIFVDDRKVSGILTEGYTSYEDEYDNYVIIGIGLNIYNPVDDFPKEIKKTAGCIMQNISGSDVDVKENLVTGIVNRLFNYYAGGEILMKECLEIYRRKSFLIGNYIKINSFCDDNSYAFVTGISDDYRLQVRYDDGKEEELSSGEVSVVKY